jgi:catechol 2,3-dioxygenase-like lactoylglutathione lyase family enzyme
MSTGRRLIPISDLFEAHLTVTDLERAIVFYRDELALDLARVFPDQKVAFFWMGAPGKAMLGLWEASAMPPRLTAHVAFRVTLEDLHEAPARLRKAGIVPADLAGRPTDEPVVLAWMPAASVYFSDPDGNLLEYITMLPDAPRSELGVVPWSDWILREPHKT